MMNCDGYQDQLLDSLYGLLAESEQQALQAHIDQCPRCQQAMLRARNQQQLLAAAARMDCSAVRFEAPSADTIAPAILPLAPRQAPRTAWGRWGRLAMAASVLVAFASLTGGGVLFWQRHSCNLDYHILVAKANDLTEQRQRALADAHQKLGEAQSRQTALEQQLREKLNAIDNSRLELVMTGSRGFQPGAPNVYEVQAKNLQGLPTQANIEARVVIRDRAIARLDTGKNAENSLGPNTIAPSTTPSTARTAKGVPAAPAPSMAPPSPGIPSVAAASKAPQAMNRSLARGGMQSKENLQKDSAREMSAFAMGEMAKDAPLTQASELAIRPVPMDGKYQLTLPPDLRVGPNSDIELEVVARSEDGQREVVRQKLDLTRPLYVTHLTTDKTVYQTGETVRFRSLTLERASLKPPEETFNLTYFLRKPRGEEVIVGFVPSVIPEGPEDRPRPGPDEQSLRGIGSGEIKLNASFPHGEYTLILRELQGRFPEQQCKFFVGDPPRRSGKQDKSDAKKLLVEFYPEGGDLVANVPNRVYFQARTPLDKPAHLEGTLVDQDGRVVVGNIQTFTVPDQPLASQGKGVFELIPRIGQRYELKLTHPKGGQVECRWPNNKTDVSGPEIKPDGVVLHVPDAVATAGEPLHVRVRSPGAERTLLVGAYCRGRLVAHKLVTVQKDQLTEVVLTPTQPVGGVYRVTVFEQQPAPGAQHRLVPVAERLVYRRPAQHLKLALEPDKQLYARGDRVNLTVAATDEKNRPAPAIVLLEVVEKKTVSGIDKAFGTMLNYFYLASEVRQPEELKDADFLVSSHAQAQTALDLLLGIQGWRRFAEQDPAKFQERYLADPRTQADAERLLVVSGQSTRETIDLLEKQRQQVVSDMEPLLQEAEKQVILAQKAAARASDTQEAELQTIKIALANTQAQLAATESRFEVYRTRWLPIAGVVLLVIAAVSLLMRRAVRFQQGLFLPAFALAVCLILAVVSLIPLERREQSVQLAAASGKPVADESAFVSRKDKGEVPSSKLDENVINLLANEQRPEHAGKGRRQADLPTRPVDAVAKAPPAAGIPASPARPTVAKADRSISDSKGLVGPPTNEPEGQKLEFARIPENRREVKEKARREMADNLSGLDKPGVMAEGKAISSKQFGEPRPGLGADKPAIPAKPLVIREYSYRHSGAGKDSGIPRSETAYWHPALVMPNGRATVSFELPDHGTEYQIIGQAHSLDGRLGTAVGSLYQQKEQTP